MYPTYTQRSEMKCHRLARASRKRCPIDVPQALGDLGLGDLQKFPLLCSVGMKTFGMSMVKELVDWAAS